MLVLAISLWLCRVVLGGDIIPDPIDYLSLTTSASLQPSRYIFRFHLSTRLLQPCQLAIQFPLQYQIGLGLKNASCFSHLLEVPVAVNCSVTERTVSFQLSQLPAGLQVFGINEVTNPKPTGGTGNFQVRTFLNGLLQDANDAYPPIGISPAPASLQATMTAQGNLYAGYSPLYVLKLALSQSLSGVWLRVTWPPQYQVPGDGLKCYLEESASYVECLSFERWSRYMHLYPGSLPVSATLRIFNQHNPAYSCQTDTLLVEVLALGSFQTLLVSSSLPGFTITPGPITNVKVQGSPLNHNLLVWYEVSFMTFNPVPEGGYIEVVFPSEFQGVFDCGPVNALKTLTGKLACEAAGNVATFLNFEYLLAGQVVVKVQAKNPTSVALSSQFVVQSFAYGNHMVDQSLFSDVLTFSSISAPNAVEVDMFRLKTETPFASYGPLELYLQTRTPIPPTNAYSQGTIQITCPVAVLTDGSVRPDESQLSCLFGKQRVPASSCALTSTNVIEIGTPASEGLECCPLAIIITTIGKPTSVWHGFHLDYNYPGLQRFVIAVLINGVKEEEQVYYYKPAPKSLFSSDGVPAAGTLTAAFMHRTTGLPNYLRLTLLPSVRIPAGGSVEFEFTTDGGGFARDLGWGLRSFQSTGYPCVYDLVDGMTFSSCSVVAGTTKSPAFIRLSGMSSALTVTARTFHLSQVSNGPVAGVTQRITVRTITSDNVVVEEGVLSTNVLTEDLKPPSPNIVEPTSSISILNHSISALNADATHSIWLGTDLNPGDGLLIIYPSEYHWPDTPTSTASIACAAGVGLGSLPDYLTLSNFDGNSFVYTASTTTVAAPSYKLNACLRLPQDVWTATDTYVNVYLVQDFKVTQYGALKVPAPLGGGGAFTITELLRDTSRHLQRTRTLYELAFLISNPIAAGTPEMAFLFPNSVFSPLAVDFSCYSLILAPIGTKCATAFGVSYSGITYSAVSLTSIPTPILLGTLFRVQVWATTLAVAGTTTLYGMSCSMPCPTGPVDVFSTTLVLDSVSIPASILPKSLLSPLIETRTSSVPIESGPLNFSLKPMNNIPYATAASKPYLQVTFPQAAAFTYDPAAYLECRFDGVLSSYCFILPGPPLVLKAYTPSTPTGGIISAGSDHNLVVTTRDSSLFSGFKPPSTPGDYLFIIESRDDSLSAAIEQTESWVTVRPQRLYEASIKSLCKGAAQWNALRFDFKVPVAVASSLAVPLQGAVWMKFPTDPVTPANAWLPDFGAGYSVSAPVDCANAGSTVPMTSSGGKFSCLLVYGSRTHFFVKLTGFDAVTAGDRFTFYLGPVKNPASTLIDLTIEVAIKEEDLSIPDNPVWTSKAELVLSYIDTTLTEAMPSTGSPDGAGSNNLFVGTPAIFGLGATLQLNIANQMPLSAGDALFIHLGTGFAPQTLTCSVLPGSTSVPTCVGFPVNGWILAEAPVALPPKLLTNYFSLKAENINLPGWGGSIVMTSYYFHDRWLSEFVQHPDFSTFAHDLQKGNCPLTTSLLQSKLQGYPDTYSFSFSCPHDVPKAGHIAVVFPGALFSAVLQPLSCAVGPGSGIALTSLTCVQSGFQVHMSGFQVSILANTPLQLLVSVTSNPLAASYANFKVLTYHSADNSKPIDLGTDTTGVAVHWSGAASKLPSFALGAEPVFHSFHDYVTTVDNVGPLSLTMSLPPATALLQNAGVLVIKSYSAITYSGQLLCVWTQSGTDYLASSCSLAANSVTMKAPKQFNISSLSPFSVLITTKHAAVEDGLKWTGSEGTYTLDLSVDVEGDNTVDAQWRTYLELRPPPIAIMSVLYDHVNVGLRNRLRLSFQHSSAIPDCTTSRLIVELPSAVLSPNLGLGVDNYPVACKVVAGLTVKAPHTSISCYLRVGTSSGSEPARIIVTGFDTVPSGTSVEIHFDRIVHPITGGDEKIVSVTLVIADVSAGWPGVRLAARTIEYLYSLQTDPTPATPTPANGFQIDSNALVGSSNGVYKLPLVAPTGNFKAGDLYVVQLDSRVSIGTPGCSPNASCVYYPGSNSLFVTLTAGASTTFDLTIAGFLNTSHLLQTGLTASAILVRSHRCIQTLIYPLSLAPYFTPGSMTDMSVSRLDTVATHYQSDRTDLLVKFTTAVPVPATGAIRITLPTGFSAGDTSCYNYPAVSTLSGVISCSYAAQSFSIAGFNAIPATSVVAIVINVVSPATSGAVSFTVTTVHSSANLNEVMDSGTTLLTLDATVAPSYHEIPLQFHVPREVRAASVAPFQAYLNFEHPFTPTTSLTLAFTFPAISLAPGGELICFIAGILYPCTLSGSTFTFTTASTLAAGRYLVLITTRLADSYEGNGLQYPSTAGSYTVILTFNDGTNNYFVDDIFELLPSNRFSELVVSAGQAAVNSMNFFTVNLKFSAAADQLLVCFPTHDPLQNPLFANDLGTGVDDSAAVPCTSTGLILTPSFTCRLNHGVQSIARPACILVLNFSAASGASASLIFDGIQNPPRAVSDSTHVHISVYAYLSGVLNTAQTFYDVMTLSWAAPTSLTHTNSNSVEAYDTDINVDLPTPCNDNDICVIVLPALMAATTSATCAGTCVGRAGSLWFVRKSNSSLSSMKVTVSVNAIPYTTSTMVAMYYLWKENSYGVYTATFQYAITLPPAFDPRNNVVSGPTFGWPDTTLPKNTVVWYNLAYKLTDPVPASGCLQFLLPAEVTVASTYCFANGDSSADFYRVTTNPLAQCEASVSTLTIKGFDALAKNSVASVSVAISTTTTLNDIKRVTFQSYYNSQCTFRIECDQGNNDLNDYNLSATLDIPTKVSLERALSQVKTASKGDNAIVRFRLKPQTSLTLATTTSLQLTFLDSPTVPSGSTLYCDIFKMSDRVRTLAPCSLTASVLTITPTIAISAGFTYEVVAYTQGAEGVVGLTLANSNTKSNVTLKTYNSGTFADFSVFNFSIPASILTDLFVWPMHTTASEMNMFSVSFTSTVTTGTYSVVVEFPCMTETVPSIDLFDDCLGTGMSSGTVLPCMTWTPYKTASNTVLTNCILYCGKCPFIPPRVKYQSVLINSGSTVNFSVLQVYNPILAADWDQAIVHIRVLVEHVSNGLVYAEGTVWNLFSVELHSPAAFASISAELATSSKVGDEGSDKLKIKFSGATYSVNGYLLVSSNIDFNPSSTTLCASSYCNFPNNNLAWASGSLNSPLQITPIKPWLSINQGTIDYFLIVGAPSGNNFQSFATNKKTSLVVDTIAKKDIEIGRYFSYYGKNTWQFNRFFMKTPFDLGSAFYIDIYLLDNGGNNEDVDSEFIEFTDNWPSTPPKWSYSGNRFRVYNLPSINNDVWLGFRFLLKTTNASPSKTYWEIYTTLGLVATGGTSNKLEEDPLGGYGTNPSVTYSGNLKELTFNFELNWKFDGKACVSGLTRVNLMDWPFHAMWDSDDPSGGSSYPGLDSIDDCNGDQRKFKDGGEMVAVLKQGSSAASVNAGNPISLKLKLDEEVSPGWNSIGVIVPSDKWNYHCGDCKKCSSCESCSCAGKGGGCANPDDGKCQFPSDCKTSDYWPSKPQDAVAVIFTKILVKNVNTITASMYSRNASSVSGAHFEIKLPAAVAAKSVFRFGFQGFTSIGYSPGDSVPFSDLNGGNTDSCWATAAYTGTMSLVYIYPPLPPGSPTTPYYYSYSAVWCQIKNSIANNGFYRIDFPYILTPASGDHLFIVQVWSYTSGGFEIAAEYYGAAAANKILVNADFIATVTATNSSPSLSNTSASALNTIALVFPATSNYAVGDVILIDLGYASGTSGMTFSSIPSASFVEISTGSPCPCLMATLTGAGGNSVIITINGVPNPGYVVIPQMTGYAHQRATAARKSYKVNFSFSSTVPSIAAGLIFTPAALPMHPNQEILFSLQFTLGGAIASPGLIQLTFPQALFADVSGTPAVSNAPGSPLKFVSSVVGSNTVVSVTGNSQSIPAGTTLLITTMWAKLSVSPVNSSISVQSYTIVGGTNYVTDDPLSTLVSVTGTYMYLSSANLWFPPAFRSGQFTPNGPSEKGVLSLYFQVPTALASTWDKFNKPASVQLSFPTNSFAFATNTFMYGVFTNSAGQVFGGYGPIVSEGGGITTYQVCIPLNVGVAASAVWRLEIGRYNGGIGLGMDLNQLVDVQIDEAGNSPKKYLQPELVFPIGARFNSVAIRPSALNTSVESYFTITFKPSAAATDGTQLVVQFPTVDILSGVQIFQPSLGYGKLENDQVPCTLYQGSTLQTGSFCRFFPGGSGSNIEQYRKEPRVVLYMAGMSLAVGTTYTWIVGGFLNPALTALRTDLTVYTRFKLTSDHVNQGEGIYLYQNYAHVKPMMTTITQATSAGNDLYQTSISSTLVTTTNISFKLGNAAGPSALDFIVFKFPWMLGVLASSTLTATAIGTYQVYLMPIAGYIAVVPNAQVASGANAAVFSLAGLSNPPYFLPSWTLANVVLSSVFYSSQCNVKSLTYNQSPPNPFYSIITTLAPTLVPRYTRMSTNYSIKHTFSVTVPAITIPVTGCLKITMPAGYQSLGSICGVSINDFAYPADCVVAPGVWKVQNFNQAIPPGATFQVFGTCLSPIAAGTQPVSVSVWADLGETQSLASGAGVTAAFVSDNRHQDPDGLLLLPQTLSKQLIRSQDYGAVYITFKPRVKVPMGNGSVTVTAFPSTSFVYTAGNSYLVCKFLDSASLQEYRGGSCNFSSSTFTVKVPPNTDLDTASTYTLRIHTTGRDPPSSENGLPYPDIASVKSVQWTLTTLSGTTVLNRFTDLMRINPLYSAFGTFKAYPISRHAGDNCMFKVLLNWSIAVGQGVTIVFPTPLYPADAGTGLTMDEDAGCAYTPSVLNTDGKQAACLLRPELYANMSPRSARFELQSPAVTTGAVTYYLPKVTNPGVNANVSVIAAVYQTLANIQALVYIGVIYNVFEVKPALVPVGPVLEDSLTAHLSTLSVSAASTSYLLISAGVPANSHVFFTFPLPMRPGTTISHQFTAHHPVQQLLALPSAPVAGAFHWAVSDLFNPAYVTTDPPVTAVIYANGYYVTSISFSQNAQAYVVGSGITASDTTYHSGLRVIGVAFPLHLTFSLPAILPSGSGFVLTFTSGTPASFCEVINSDLPLVAGDFLGCQVTALKMYLTGLGSYAANTDVEVTFWVTAVAPIAFGFEVYLDGGSWTQLMWTASYTSPGAFLTQTPLTGVSVVSPLSKHKVIRSGTYSPLQFNLKLATQLTHNAGTFTFTFPLGALGYDSSISVDSDLRAVWVKVGAVYLGKSCVWTSTTSITAQAPEVNDVLAATDWTLVLTTVNQNNREGLQNPPTFNTGQIWVYGAGSSLGTVVTDYGGALMTVVPSDFAQGWAETYSLTPAQYSGFRLNFTPAVDIASGFEAMGTTEIVVQVGKSAFVLPNNLGGLANPGSYNYGPTDCFPTAGLTVLKCYIKSGDASAPPQVWLRQFAAVVSGTSSQFSILPVMNPATKGQMVHLRLFTRIYTAPTWTFTQYRELDYTYMTEDSTVTSQPIQTVSLSDWKPQTSSNHDWTVQTTGPLLATGLDGVLLRLTSLNHLLTGATVTTNTLRILSVNYMYFVQAGASFTSPIHIKDVPTASYCQSKQWDAFVLAGGYMTDTMTYSLFTDCADHDHSATASITRFTDPNVPNPLVSRTDRYQMAFKPSVTVLFGGEIVIGVPAAYVLSPFCRVTCGLTGFIQCISSGNTYILTGFEKYSFADVNLYIFLTFFLTAQNSPVTAAPFTINIYGVNGDLTTHTEAASFGSFSIVNAPTVPIFTAALNPLYWEQVCAYLLGYAHFYVDFQPNVAYPYGSFLYIDLPQGTTLVSPAVVECSLTDGSNVVPSEGGCSVLAGSLKVKVPEQLQPAVGTPYTLIVKVRDSGTLASDGLKLPSATDIKAASGNPAGIYWYWHLESGATTLEAAKFGWKFCGRPYVSASVSTGHGLLNDWNFFDASLKSDFSVPDSGAIIVEFATHNELAPLFSLDLGLGALTAVDCAPIAGFELPNPLTLTCTLLPAALQTKSTPAVVQITSNKVLAASTTHAVRMVKLKNPLLQIEPLFTKQLLAHFRVYVYSALDVTGFLLNDAICYRVFNENTLYALPLATARVGTAVTTGLNPPTLTLDLITPPNYIEYSFTEDSVTLIGPKSGAIIFIMDSSFVLFTSGTSLTPTLCSVFSTCSFSVHDASKWIVMTVSGAANTPRTTSKVNFTSINTPSSSLPAGYPVEARICSGAHRWTDTYSATFPMVLPRPATAPVAVNPESLPNRNTYRIFTIPIDMKGVPNTVVRVDYIFPSEFQWVDAVCLSYTNLARKTGPGSTGDVVCQTDCSLEKCTNRVTVSNFQLKAGVDSFTFKIRAMNPLNEGTTSPAQLFYYNSETDITQIAQQSLDAGTYSILHPTYSFDVWLYWPTEDLYSRTVKAGEMGEIVIRLQSSVFTPPSTGRIQIVLPEVFDIASQGTPVCTLGYGDMPFDNYPWLPWKYEYSHVPSNLCTWENRVVVARFPDILLRQWYGMGDKCAFIVLSTTGSTTNGFRAPFMPGYYDLQVYAMDGTFTVLEATFPKFSVSGPFMPSDFSVFGLVRDARAFTNIGFKFTSTVLIPPGYRYLTPNGRPGTFSNIEVRFETYQGFAPDLATGLHTGDQVPCYAEAGLRVHYGDKLTCVLTLGDLTLSTPSPAVLTISGYEQIEPGTFIQIVIPKVKNPVTALEARPTLLKLIATLRVGVYVTDIQGQVTWLYAPTVRSPYDVTLTTVVPVTYPISGATGQELDSLVQVKLPFSLTTPTTANDLVVIDFPRHFTNLPSNLVLSVYASPSNALVQSSLPILLYADVMRLVGTLPTPLAAATSYYLRLDNLRLPQFVDANFPATITYFTVQNHYIGSSFQVLDLFVDLNIQLASFNAVVSADKLFAGEVYVELTFTASLLAFLPSGSAVVAGLHTNLPSAPNEFPSLLASSPPAFCTTSLAGTCTVSYSSVTVYDFGALPRSHVFSITIIGVKAPAAPGLSQPFYLNAYTAAAQHVARTTLPGLLFAAQRLPLSLDFTFTPQFQVTGVVNVFTLEIVRLALAIPTQTRIELTIPIAFNITQNLQCEYMQGFQVNTPCVAYDSYRIRIVLQNSVPVTSTIAVRFQGITSPRITDLKSATYTGLSVTLTYDSTLLLASSPGSVTLGPPPPALSVLQQSLSPTNEAEYSLHNLTFQLPVELPGDPDFGVLVKYPIEFISRLIPTDILLTCTTEPKARSCIYVWPRQVLITGFEELVFAYFNVTLSLFGLNNPQWGGTGQLSIYALQISTRRVLAFTETGGSFNLTRTPAALRLLALNSSVPTISSRADYAFAFNTESNVLASGVVWVDWPETVRAILTANVTECEGPGRVQLACQWEMLTNRKRISLSDSSISQANQNVSFVFRRLQTPRIAGPTPLFSVRLFDWAQVTSRSYHNLHGNDYLSFVAANYSVELPVDLPWGIIKGTYSDMFHLRLGLATYYQITIVPIADYSVLAFSPASFFFQYIYDFSTAFRVGAPANSTTGSYAVYFFKYENSSSRGEMYSAVPEIPIRVIDPNASLPIRIGEVAPLTVGTLSLPVAIDLDNPPFEELVLTPWTESPSQDEAVQVFPAVIRFAAGEMRKSFQIRTSHGAVTGSLRFSLSGISAAAYYLPSNQSFFSVSAPPYAPVTVLSLNIIDLNRTSAKFSARFSGPVRALYLCAPAGIPQPSAQQLYSKTRLVDTVPHIFGEIYVEAYQKVANILVTGLVDDFLYVMYVGGQDLRGDLVTTVQKLTFRTLESPPPATFSIQTTKLMSRQTVERSLAAALAVPDGLVASRGIDPAIFYTGKGRLLEIQPLKYDLILIANRTKEDPKPLKLVLQLDSHLSIVQQYLPALDSSVSIAATAAEYKRTRVRVVDVNITFVTGTSVSVNLTLNTDGVIYAAVLPAEDGNCLGQQLIEALDSNNRPIASDKWLKCTYVFGFPCVANFTGLQNGAKYKLWVSGETEVPGHYDLMRDYDIREVDLVDNVKDRLKGVLLTMKDAAAALASAWLLIS